MSCSNNTNQNNQLFGGLKMPLLNGGSNMLKGSEYESSGSPSVVPQSGSSYYTHDMNNGTKDYAGSYAPVVSQSQQFGGKRKTRKSKKNLQISHSDFENVYSISLRRKRSNNNRSQSNKRNNRSKSNKRNNRSQSNRRNNRSQSNRRNNRSQSNRRNNRTRSRSNRRKN